jgi:hypothetical protein
MTLGIGIERRIERLCGILIGIEHDDLQTQQVCVSRAEAQWASAWQAPS